jgi:hypothetical protein
MRIAKHTTRPPQAITLTCRRERDSDGQDTSSLGSPLSSDPDLVRKTAALLIQTDLVVSLLDVLLTLIGSLGH